MSDNACCSDSSGAMAYYTVYGVTIWSDVPLRSPLTIATPPHDLRITEAHGTLALDGAQVLTIVPDEYRNDLNIEAAYRLGSDDLLLFPGGDQVLLRADQMTYHHAGPEGTREDYVDARLLGTVFAWWLLRQGRIPLHAGAVVLDGEAVLFLAERGTGKSSMLASLLAGGVPLLCDDFVAVYLSVDGEPLAASAYPQMRLWPQTIEQFIGSTDEYPSVFDEGTKRRVPVGGAWGRFLAGLYPVTRIYLLQRGTANEGEIEVRRCTGHEAFMSLLSALLMSANFPASDLQRVWPDLQQMAERVPIYELTYPTGWQWMPHLHRVIAEPPRVAE